MHLNEEKGMLKKQNQLEKKIKQKKINQKKYPKEKISERKIFEKKDLNEKRSQTNEKNVCLVKDHTKHDRDHSVSIDMQQKKVVYRKTMHLKLNAIFEKERICDESTSAHRESLILVH